MCALLYVCVCECAHLLLACIHLCRATRNIYIYTYIYICMCVLVFAPHKYMRVFRICAHVGVGISTLVVMHMCLYIYMYM